MEFVALHGVVTDIWSHSLQYCLLRV